jgi:hypothetical protein
MNTSDKCEPSAIQRKRVLLGPSESKTVVPKGDHVGIIRPSDLKGHGVLGSVLLRKLLGEGIMLALVSAGGVDIVEGADAA